MNIGTAGFFYERWVVVCVGGLEHGISSICFSDRFKDERFAQVGSSGAGWLVARDDFLGLMSRMTKRPMTRRSKRRRIFRFSDFLW